MADAPGLKSVVANANVLPVINSIFDFSAEALGELKTWLEGNPPSIPVTQIIGFSSFAAQGAPRINVSQNTTSATYTDLGTVGPSLTGLPDGRYVLLFGAALATPAGAAAQPFMSLSINSVVPSDDNEALQGSTTGFGVGGMTATLRTLSNGGNNSVVAVYRSSDGATVASFNHRWLIALKYANA